jgi:hypothetical protein
MFDKIKSLFQRRQLEPIKADSLLTHEQKKSIYTYACDASSGKLEDMHEIFNRTLALYNQSQSNRMNMEDWRQSHYLRYLSEITNCVPDLYLKRIYREKVKQVYEKETESQS